MGLIALTVVSITISYLLAWVPSLIQWLLARKRLIHAIDRLPGPKAFPLVGCAYQFSFDSYMKVGHFKGTHQAILESSVETSKPKEGYGRLQEWLGTSILTSNGERWRSKRKMLTPAFHFSILNDFMAIFNKEATILLDQFSQFADSRESVDVFPFIKLCALDIICADPIIANRMTLGRVKERVWNSRLQECFSAN